MNQDIINEEEWKNSKNWSIFVYSSARDSRMIVPKRWGFGWTINFGNKKGVWLFVGLLAIPVGGLVVSLILKTVVHGK